MFVYHTTCRACGFARKGSSSSKAGQSNRLIPVFDLGLQPLANDFRESGEEVSGFAPLEVLWCPNCGLAQLSVVVNPHLLFGHYSYVTSRSKTMQDHFDTLLAIINEEADADHVLEIGSNDGTLLQYLLDHGASKVLGIDPAENLSETARKDGIPTLTTLFDRKSANEVAGRFADHLDVILARHVFCHLDDWKEFVDCLAVPSTKETLVCIEVPYVQDLLDKAEFDTIYHEHLSYFSVRAMRKLLEDSAWRLHRIVKVGIHGGSLLVMLRRKDHESKPTVSVQSFLEEEECDLEAWSGFATRVGDKIGLMKRLVREWKSKQKRIAGYGASAKSTVWINACRFTNHEIEYVTDTTPQKQYCRVPGTQIPIKDPAAIVRDAPDLMILFAWNYRTEVLQKEAKFSADGGKWLIPQPEVEVI